MTTVWIGWALAAAALVVGWQAYGWQGLVMAVSVIVFWLLLQFTRTMRVMRQASGRPIGSVTSAVMLQSKLHPGIPLLDVIKMTGSLGRRIADGPAPPPTASRLKAPETYAWADPGGAEVQVLFGDDGKVVSWTFSRPTDAEAAS